MERFLNNKINIELLENFETELNSKNKEDHVDTLINIMKFIDTNKDKILGSFKHDVHEDTERLKELYEQVKFPHIWNYEMLEDCSKASIMDWDKSRKVVIHELSIDWELRAFLAVQHIDDPLNNRKYVEWFWSFMIESKEIFWLSFFEKEVLRRFICDFYKDHEYQIMFWNMQMQFWIQKRFNYYAINVANLEKIEDYFNLMESSKNRKYSRARFKKLENDERIEFEVNKLDETFDPKKFLDRWIELAKKKWIDNMIWYWTKYEENTIKAFIKHNESYEFKVNFKWRNIAHYLVSITGWIMHWITWYYDNFDFDEEDRNIVNQASKYLVFKRVQFSIDNKIPLMILWAWNFWWKVDYCNVCWYVYFLNV